MTPDFTRIQKQIKIVGNTNSKRAKFAKRTGATKTDLKLIKKKMPNKNGDMILMFGKTITSNTVELKMGGSMRQGIYV